MFELKERATKLLYEMDDVIEILKKMLGEKNPLTVVTLSYELGSFVDGRSKITFDPYDLDRLEEFYYALEAHKTRKELLRETGNEEFYNSLIEVIKSNVITALANFFTNHSNDAKDKWMQMELKVDAINKKFLSIEFNEYEAQLVETDHRSRTTKVISKKFVTEDGSMYQISHALNNSAFGDETQNPERKAKKYYWVFTRDFHDLFFEVLGLKEES